MRGYFTVDAKGLTSRSRLAKFSSLVNRGQIDVKVNECNPNASYRRVESYLYIDDQTGTPSFIYHGYPTASDDLLIKTIINLLTGEIESIYGQPQCGVESMRVSMEPPEKDKSEPPITDKPIPPPDKDKPKPPEPIPLPPPERRICPEVWVENRMPIVIQPGEKLPGRRGHLIIEGVQRDLNGFSGEELNWMQENCKFEERIVY